MIPSGVSIALILLHLLTLFSGSTTSPTYLKADISVNCGSVGTWAGINGQHWIGDENPNAALTGKSTSSHAIHKLISGDPVIHRTARISESSFSYSFHLNQGQKIIRLHFNPVSYKGFKGFTDLFTVEVGPFTLMSNFSASLTAQALAVNTFTKEFYMSIQENQLLSIIFFPTINPSLYRTYAFINGIEIISVPPHLTYFRGGDLRAQIIGQKSPIYIDNNTALEIIHRFNGKWNSALSSGELDIHEIKSHTWKRLVDVGFRYLVRAHFSGLGLKMAAMGNVMFTVLINEMVVDTYSDIVDERGETDSLLYRDYLMVVKGRKRDGKRDLSISLQSTGELIDGQGLIKGFEILKLSNPDDSLASFNPVPQTKNRRHWISRNLLLGQKNATSTIIILMIALVNITVHMLRKHCEVRHYKDSKNNPSARAERLCRRFLLAEMKSATRNFSDAFFIGKGGFGKVYKGLVDNGQKTVAIKRLKSYSKQGKREFLAEIETLTELRHINLVSLIGYCNDHGEMILVYEYLTGGTLADHLYKHARRSNSNTSSLTWKQRLNICIGAGRGLDYLHTGHGVIHRDVKAANILLDEKLVAKVADFGLAKLEDRSNSQTHISTNVKGTPGYLDPYYFNTRRLSRKSDIYAFGVVLFQVLSGRSAMDPSFGQDEVCLTKWARNKINMGEVDQIIDSSLAGEIRPECLTTFVEIAESCLHDEPKNRPNMSQVVVQLELALEQQEKTKITIPNLETKAIGEISPSKNETTLCVSTEQLSVASPDAQTVTASPTEGTNSKTISTELPAGNKDKTKVRPMRIWARDALWNIVKPSKKKESATTSSSPEAEMKSSKYQLDILEAATNQFSASNKIGGDLGSVYKAVLSRRHIVAVKRLSPTAAMQHVDELKNEIFFLSNLQHPHVIKLLDYCIDEAASMLVYEFMSNGSLDTYIFNEVHRPLLSWDLRFKIIMGIAKGILYLQQYSGKRIIHTDINAKNILLDSQMNPKITGFGYALTFNEYQSAVERRTTGTIGYMAPEVANSGKVSVTSDVYSFGILVLEALSGKEKNLQYAWKLWNECTPLHLVDESLKGLFSEQEALRCIQVGLLCTQKEPRSRPTIDIVHKMLLGELLHAKVADASSFWNIDSVKSDDDFFKYDSTREREKLKLLNSDVSWCKLITSVSLSETGYFSGGGLLRNNLGEWMMGFSAKFGECSVIEAGLLALREGLRHAWERRIQKIVVETNQKFIVILFKKADTNTNLSFGPIIAECRALIKLPWVCDLKFIKKGGNKCADTLAKKGHEIDVLKLVWEKAPKELISLLKEDAVGYSVPPYKVQSDSLLLADEYEP